MQEIEKRNRIVKRVAKELRDGFYVNLGHRHAHAGRQPCSTRVLRWCCNRRTACWGSGLIRWKKRWTPT